MSKEFFKNIEELLLSINHDKKLYKTIEELLLSIKKAVFMYKLTSLGPSSHSAKTHPPPKWLTHSSMRLIRFVPLLHN